MCSPHNLLTYPHCFKGYGFNFGWKSEKELKMIWSYSKAWIYCSQYVAISSQKGSKMALTELLLTKQKKPLKKGLYCRQSRCGEGGIRTHEEVTPLLP